jgi:hypothetical protein
MRNADVNVSVYSVACSSVPGMNFILRTHLPAGIERREEKQNAAGAGLFQV